MGRNGILRLAKTLELLAAALGRLAIWYVTVGSVASSARGSNRATEDLRVVAAIGPAQIPAFCETLGPDWYVDGEQIRGAIAAGRAFNLIYVPLSQKVHVFPVKDDFGSAQVEHATTLPIAAAGGRVYPIASAEDIVLAKLRWYHAGGEVSERQWSDIAGVIRATPGLDWNYVEAWAVRLGVAQLLERARSER